MSKIEDLIKHMQHNPRNVRFNDLCKVCDHYFGLPRQQGAVIAYIKHHGRAILE
ncbi:hypothetical protein ASZ90_008056 [hydrocarbon metagenome]|uniref:Uncharacterized protein n=1 Tax=hydrocarbon metagenome TaxID=938273 RepID=A0A0W8FMN2_9ZZZZ